MASLRDAISESVRSSACSVLSSGANFAANFERLVDAIAPDTPFPVASPAAGLQAAYGLLCNRPAPPVESPPPFTGGQCPVTYTVTTTYTRTVSGAPQAPQQNTFFNIPGTIKGTESFTEGTTVGVRLVFGIPGNPSGTAKSNIVSISNAVPNNIAIASSGIVSVVRTDGLPDNCGDPPGIEVEPNPDPLVDDPDITYDNDEGDEVTNNFTLVFSPAFLNVFNEVTIPVNIVNNDDDNFVINANLNLINGDVNFYGGNPSYPPGSNRPPKDGFKPANDLPDTPPDLPDLLPPPFPVDNNPEAVEIIAACVVTVTDINPNISAIFQGDNPTIFAPNLGYINFAIPVGDSIAWTSDIAVKNQRNFIVCEWEAGAIDVSGTPRPGVEWEITPIYLIRTANDQ